MRKLYKILFLFVLVNLSCVVSAKNNSGDTNLALPIATISGTAAVCLNAAQPQITFTGSGGTAPYVFTYNISGGTSLSVKTTSGNSVTVSAPTTTAGTFIYNLISVHDAANPSAEQSSPGTATVTVNPQPNANLNTSATSDTFNGFPVFKICSNQNTSIDFYNASTTTASNVSYTINWGDNTPDFTSSNNWTTTAHNYSVGIWTLLYTIKGSNVCDITKTYKVFIGNNPAVGLGNPGNTDICISSSLTFPITGTENNPPGTTYTVTFNDGSAAIPLNHPPPASITHTFLKNSCGTTSSGGSTTYQNSFYASIVAINPCDQSSASVVPIRISTPPVANFSLPKTVLCTNNEICLTNTSSGGDSATSSSCSPPKIIWTISPNSGYTLASGSLGNDFGTTNTNTWTSGSTYICPVFTNSGTYTITMKVGNHCDTNQISKTICVESPLTPQFTIINNSGCSPMTVTTANTTVTTNPCTSPTYVWSVIHTPAYCGTNITTIPNQTTTNASYNFTEPGTYSITLTATNSCGSFSTSQSVTVKKPPTINSINGILANYCGPTNINPAAAVISCAPASSTLTYAWNFPGGIPTTSSLANPGPISYTSSGNYTVSLMVSNECGAGVMATKSFTINDTPALINTPLNQTICSGATTALVNLTSSPAGATFSWTATATTGISGFNLSGTNTIPTQTISTTNAGPGTVTYAVTPSLGGCSGSVTNYVITVNPAPTITQPVSSTVCLGGTPTIFSVTITGATGTPTYQWYSNTVNNTTSGTAIPSGTNATYAPPSTAAGTLYYYCIITLPSGGCSNIKTNTAAVTIMPNATITFQPTPTQNLCVGLTSTPLTIAYSGGTGTASYQWYSSITNSNIGGSSIAGATAATYSPPVFTSPGNYYYYATVSLNGNGCLPATSNVAEVIVFADPTISSQPIATQTLCQNAAPANLDVTAAGGNGAFSYQWYSNSINSNSGGAPIPGATSSSYVPPTSAVGTKYYYGVVTQNSTSGCSVSSATAAIVVISAPTITQPASSAVCVGGNPTALSIVVSGATGTPSYQWFSNNTNSNSGGTEITGETNAVFSPPNTPVGTVYYYAVVTLPSGGCSSITSNTASVTINAGAIIDIQPTPTQSLCVGATVSTPLSITYSGGTGTASYQWYSNNTSTNSGGTLISGATNSSFTPLVFTTTGTFHYYAVVTLSGNGCGPITSNVAEIVIVADPVISSQPLATQTICQNVVPTSLSVAASGGIGALYSYQWFSNASNNNTTGTPILGATSDTYSPPTSSIGTLYYYCVVTQTNGSGCAVSSNTAAVVVNLAPTFNSQPLSSNICIGQTPTLLSVSYANGVGTPAYQWYSNGVNTISGRTPISGATNATYAPPNWVVGIVYYYAIITLPSGGCSSLTSTIASVTVNQNPIISNKNSLICSDNTFTITPNTSGGDIVPMGTTYTWTNPIISPAGSITGASAQLAPQTNISQTLINTTTSPATVTYTVKPLSGICTGINFTIVVTVNPAISPNVTSTNNACFGANNGAIQSNITGGIPFSSGAPYLISWTGLNGFTAAASSISNLAPGNYNLSITDAGGCPINETYLITEPDDIVITTDLEKDITCFSDANGEIKITITGGTLNYTFAWTKNGTAYANTEDLANLSPGIYAVTVSDANNCGPKTATFTITEPPILAVNLANKTNILCFGDATGTITVNVAGGTLPYSYSWIGPNGFTSSNQNLAAVFAGTYDLIVTDNSGCVKNLSVQLTQTPEIIIQAATTPIVCYGANDASINTVVSGGIAPYQISWSNLGSGTFQDNLSAGDYLITVTDALNCIQTLTVNIPEAPIFTINPVVKNITCFGDKNGSINLNIVGGIVPVKLTWSDSAVAGTIRNNLGPGSYTVTITDGKPCTITKTFIILEPQLLVLSANITNAFDCDNANSGAINLLVYGGSAPFTYIWSNGATTEDLVNIPAGNYLVTVTDANGCSKQAQYSINRPPPIVTGVVTKTDFDCESKYVKQTFVADVSGGVPPYQLVWSSGAVSGANNEMMNTNQNGTVILNVTDAIGCKSNYTFNVDVPTLGTPSFDASSYAYSTFGIYSVNDPIQFTNTATGDYVGVFWDFGDGSVSEDLNPVHAFVNPKDYVVTQTVTYPFGCVYVQKITFVVGKGYVLVVPTAFTPNNDSLNDTFRPVTKGLKNVHLDVYDTWGSLIYSETGDILRGWDGKLKGINAENGNYYCKVSGATFYGTIVNENHPFVLIK